VTSASIETSSAGVMMLCSTLSRKTSSAKSRVTPGRPRPPGRSRGSSGHTSGREQPVRAATEKAARSDSEALLR
jgi:hypothetical protein